MNKNILFSKYKMIKKIGSGGMSIAYLVKNCDDNCLYVLKKIKKTDPDKPDLLQKIIKENISLLPKIIEINEAMNFLYTVEEYISGQQIDHIIKRRVINLNEIIRWFIAICSAVSQLHNMLPYPVIHGDIKPSNIIIQNDNTVKIIDYSNLTCLSGDAHYRKSCYGTPGYAAPEMISMKRLTVQSDIYGIGAALYHVITGNRPAVYNLEYFVLKEEIEGMIARIIYKCVRNNPENRYESAEQIISDMKKITCFKF